MMIFTQNMTVKNIIHNSTSMQPLERFFGRDVLNIAPKPHQSRPSRTSRPKTQRLSLVLPKKSHNQSIPPQAPNLSTRIQKPKAVGEERRSQGDHLEGLTAYFRESMEFMLSQQMGQLPLNNYLSGKKEVNQAMRGVLLDWLVDVHLKLKMFPQTLFIIVAVIDSYLAKRTTKKQELQLVGVAALFMCAKYEETYRVPEADELVAISGQIFSREQLIKKESQIILALDFNMVFNTSYHFLSPLCKLLQYDSKKEHLAQYIIELALLDAKFLKYRSSLLASSTIYLVNKVKRRDEIWPDEVREVSGYEEAELKNCAKQLCHLLEGAEHTPATKNLRKKFGQPRFSEVSKMRLERKEKGC